MMQMVLKGMVISMKSNKKNNKSKKIFKKIYNIIDGLIVTPISTLVYKVQKKIGNDNKFEKLLSRPYALLILSGIIAATFTLLVNIKASSFVQVPFSV